MTKRTFPVVRVRLDRIVGGGQTIATMDDGRKLFAWGGLPGELVDVQINKKKSKLWEGVVTCVLEPSQERTEPRDPDSFISTSPWQIMTFEAEQRYKSELIDQAFLLNHVDLPDATDVYTDGVIFEYRNKIEFSFWHDTDTHRINLAFFRRGTHGKISTNHTSLAHPHINLAAQTVLSALNQLAIEGRQLKTLLIRSTRSGGVAWQLYVKDDDFDTEPLLNLIEKDAPDWLYGCEIIYSEPKSPASVVTKRLSQRVFSGGSASMLSDQLLGRDFTYAVEGFFQINIPVYEQAIQDIATAVKSSNGERPVVDMYSGVGTIGLSLDAKDLTLVELNPAAVHEMKQNITRMARQASAKVVLAASEKALDYITTDATIVVDPPRAGLHTDVIEKLLLELPERIIYLSCNPTTQARDYALLQDRYQISSHRGYNFFPRTPHIEHLIVLDLK